MVQELWKVGRCEAGWKLVGSLVGWLEGGSKVVGKLLESWKVGRWAQGRAARVSANKE